MLPTRRHTRGVTLIELVIACGLGASLVYLGIALYRMSTGTQRSLMARQESAGRLQNATQKIRRVGRLASLCYKELSTGGLVCEKVSLATGMVPKVRFALVDKVENGVTVKHLYFQAWDPLASPPDWNPVPITDFGLFESFTLCGAPDLAGPDCATFVPALPQKGKMNQFFRYKLQTLLKPGDTQTVKAQSSFYVRGDWDANSALRIYEGALE